MVLIEVNCFQLFFSVSFWKDDLFVAYIGISYLMSGSTSPRGFEQITMNPSSMANAKMNESNFGTIELTASKLYW